MKEPKNVNENHKERNVVEQQSYRQRKGVATETISRLVAFAPALLLQKRIAQGEERSLFRRSRGNR